MSINTSSSIVLSCKHKPFWRSCVGLNLINKFGPQNTSINGLKRTAGRTIQPGLPICMVPGLNWSKANLQQVQSNGLGTIKCGFRDSLAKYSRSSKSKLIKLCPLKLLSVINNLNSLIKGYSHSMITNTPRQAFYMHSWASVKLNLSISPVVCSRCANSNIGGMPLETKRMLNTCSSKLEPILREYP